MLHTYHSNHLEVLAARLAEVLRNALPAPFARDIIVTQSNGLARWLELRLADHLGIAAQLSFQFPTSFLWEMARCVLGNLPPTSAFEQPQLGWRLMQALAELGDEPCYASLHNWLGTGDDDFRRYELASRIAACFEQYQIYRPDWIERWEQGQEQHWQAALWRRLATGSAAHRGQVQMQLYHALQHGQVNHQRLPQRVSIIGISAVPPLYLELLAALGRYMEVHLLLLNPCQEYWGDIRAAHDVAQLSVEQDAEAEYLSIGHPLLASLGKQGRDFMDRLNDYPTLEWQGFVEPRGTHLLAQLQADILHLRERGTEEHPALLLATHDRSLQIHVCHTPMREVEVLHDQLLDLFANDAKLRPSDVVVMTPDIARYGPLLEAVFGTAPAARRIPFSIADQGLALENPLIEAFFTLLDLVGERFDAAQVLNMLEPAALSRRFGLSDADMTRIRHWVREVGIRWGMDAAGKAAWELPTTKEHTWEAGLERLLLGYALPGHGRERYADILPYDQIEGSEAQALGGLQRFIQALLSLQRQVRVAQPPAHWLQTLHGMLECFFEPREAEETELQILRDALQALGEQLDAAQCNTALSLAVIKSALRQLLNAPESGLGRFLGGGVTCCAMVPMRSIPFSVVCLLGMDDDAYPRPSQSVSFDLLTTSFRRGDRSRRRDDRYLFLETLLSARRFFYLSYVGQSVRDNATVPPSVLVSELLEVVDRSFSSATQQPPSVQLTTRHPLQPFSQRYFNGAAHLFSYSAEWVAASAQAGCGECDTPILLDSALPELDAGRRWVNLDELLQFFKHPTRWLLRERLGIRMEAGEEALATREPFVLDALENYQMVNQMLELHREQYPAAEIEALLRAGGALPHAQVGECVFADAYQRVEVFAGRLGRVLPYQHHEALALDIDLGAFRLSGRVAGMTKHGWVGYRLAKVKANDYLRLWLHHLALHAQADTPMNLPSYWVAEDQLIALNPNPPRQARELLRELLEIYWQGTQRLLHFFPKSALAYFQKTRSDKPQQALETAQAIWQGKERQAVSAEREDVYYQLAFAESDPLDAEFAELSERVFAPLFAQIRTEEDGDS